MGASTILVLDDGQHSLEGLTGALEDAGYAPIAITENDDPVGQFEALTPELVFLSLKSTGALEICEAIRLTGHGAIVPVIFVGNGHAKVRSASDALTFGGDYHFGEPLELGKILAKVQTYVGAPPAVHEEVTKVDVAPVVDLARLAGGMPNVDVRAKAGSASDLASASDDLLAQIEAESRVEAERQTREQARRRADEEAERFLAEEAQRQADRELAALTAEADERRAAEEERRKADEEAERFAEQEERRLEARRAEEAAAEKKRADDEARRRAVEEAERLADEARREAEEDARRRAEEQARRLAEEARREAEEQARLADEERVRREAEERERRAAEERQRREAEELARREAEERARREAEERARREAEEQARREAEERARREAEDQARREAEERARREAEEQARREAEERERREAEDRARRDQEERERREAEERLRREAELKARRDLEERMRREAEEQARREAEERARRESEEQARREAEERARREAEEQARREAEERARREAEERARREAEEQARREAEERARREAEELARRAAEEQARREAEEAARREEARRRAEEEARRQEEVRRRLEEEEEARRRAEAEAEALRLAEEEIRQQRLAEEARRRAEEEAKRRAEEERRRLEAEAEAEARRLADEARRKLEEELERAEAERRAAEEAKERAAEEVRRRSEEAARRKFAPAKPVAARGEPESGLTIAATLMPLSGSKSSELQPPSVIEDMEPRPGVPSPLVEASTETTQPLAQSLVASMSATPARVRPHLRAFTPEEGTFNASADMADLLAEAFRQQVTGRIDFTSGTRQKSVVFERGQPVDAYSSQVYDRMEEYLAREGRITKAQYQEVRVKGLRGPRRIGAFLVSEGYLRPDELFTAVRGHLEELVYSLFEWDEATYAYVAEHVDDDNRVTLERDARALVTEGIRRKYLLPRAVQKLGSPSSLLTRTDPEGRIDADALGLTTEERQIARLVDGSRNVDDIVFSSGLGALRVYHVLSALCATGYAEVAVRGIEGLSLNGATDLDGIDRQRILERVEQVRQADYFQILGISRGATTYEVEAAFDRITRELAPPRLSPAIRGALKNEIDEIERVLEDARDVLRDQRMRESYARNLPRL